MRREGICEGGRCVLGREEGVDLMEKVLTVNYLVGGGVRIRAKMAPHPLRAVHSRQKRGLARSALGESLYTEGCVERTDEVAIGFAFRKLIGPPMSPGEGSKCISLVESEGIGRGGRAEAHPV